MKIELTETYSTAEHTYTVAGVPDIDMEFITATIRPSRLVVKLSQMNSEPWGVQAIDVTGPKVLTNGRVSTKTYHTAHWYGPDRMGVPDWARNIARGIVAQQNGA